LQSGKQKEALEMIVTLSTLMSNMIAIVPLLPHEHSKELRDQITALNGDFEELHQSIAHKDFVLVSDLIEYEICAKLDKLLQTIDS